MYAGDARQVATDWVQQHAMGLPRFRGSFLTGSVLTLAPGDWLPSSSDVDIKIVLAAGHGLAGRDREDQSVPAQLKFRHRGVLLDVSYLDESALADAEAVARIDYLAAAMRTGLILADPTGRLHELHRSVAADYSRRSAIEKRVETRRAGIGAALRGRDRSRPWPDQVMRWLFPTTLTTHLVLAAALRPPTVRKRYVACRQVLIDHDQPAWHSEFLGDLGCVDLSREITQHHLDRLANIFDHVARRVRTRFFFSADLLSGARPVAIDGSEELVGAGLHREAAYWIMATFCRCQLQLCADDPQVARRTAPMFDEAAAELLQVTSVDDLDRRSQQTITFMDRARPLIDKLIENHAGRQ